MAHTLPERLRVCCTRYDSLPYLCTPSFPDVARLSMQVGLLSKDNTEQIPFAYKLYKSSVSSDDTLAQGFKETFCRPVPIQFVGVWWVLMMGTRCPRGMLGTEKRLIDRDTVASVGVIMGRSLPFADVNTTIKVFRQALSLDEVSGGRLIYEMLT